jgi:hypothetical protein
LSKRSLDLSKVKRLAITGFSDLKVSIRRKYIDVTTPKVSVFLSSCLKSNSSRCHLFSSLHKKNENTKVELR